MEADMRDLVIIGGGAGGVPAAIRAAQLGGRVSIVESRDLGGQCMNRGCIPLGQMMESSGILGSLALGKEMGIGFSEVSKDYGALIDRQNRMVEFMRQGVKGTLAKKGVETIQGKGRIVGKGTVEVGGKIITSKSILLATGATWLKPDFPGSELDDVVTSDDLFAGKGLPARVLLYGQSPWLVEMAQFLHRYDVQVILATPEKRIISGENKTISTRLLKALKNEGIKVMERCEILGGSRKRGCLEVELSHKKRAEKVLVDKLITLERGAALKDLGLESVGLGEKDGYIPVNERMETDVEGIYAIGDVAAPPRRHYSHLASQQGMIAAENAMGGNAAVNPLTLTRVLFTQPQVACVGLTEKEAKERGYEVVIGAAPLSMNAYGMIISESNGLVEVVAEKGIGEILGVNFIGKSASEMAGQGVLAIQMEATLEDLAYAPFPHPTLSESLAEAARSALGRQIYFP